MSKLTAVPGMVSVYGAAAVAAAWLDGARSRVGRGSHHHGRHARHRRTGRADAEFHHRKVYPVLPLGLSGGAAGLEGPRRPQNN